MKEKLKPEVRAALLAEFPQLESALRLVGA